jgi:AcrR family transcriptional regulator
LIGSKGTALTQTKSKQAPARRNRQYERRQSTILKAASRVIAQKGFEGASVRDVAARGGVGLSGIYYYFKNKDELLYAIQSHTFSTLVNSLDEKLKICSSPKKKLKAVIDNHLQFFVNNMDDLKVCVHEMESLSGKYYKDVLRIRREYFRLVREVVSEFFRGTNSETDVATLFLFGSLNWVYMWYDPKKNADVDKLSSQFLRVYLNGIKPS